MPSPPPPKSTGITITASRAGIHLPEADVWLDGHRKCEVSFITHAHSDHVAGHVHTVCSPLTAAFLRERYDTKCRITELAWDQPWEHGNHRFLLTPAGHIMGSAMVHVTRLRDGATLLYTGDFKLRTGLCAEPARPLPAEALIMECTFGHPRYQFPEFAAVRESMHTWCHRVLEEGRTPVLLGYSLGKAQEIQALLGGAFPVAVHSAIAALNRTCEPLGWPLPPWEEWRAETPPDRVLVMPPAATRQLKNTRTALVSGWAMDASARYRYRCEEAFALSDHADWPDLWRLVEQVQPNIVYTTHGPSADFASRLRRAGWNAWSLRGGDQMELALGGA